MGTLFHSCQFASLSYIAGSLSRTAGSPSETSCLHPEVEGMPFALLFCPFFLNFGSIYLVQRVFYLPNKVLFHLRHYYHLPKSQFASLYISSQVLSHHLDCHHLNSCIVIILHHHRSSPNLCHHCIFPKSRINISVKPIF